MVRSVVKNWSTLRDLPDSAEFAAVKKTMKKPQSLANFNRFEQLLGSNSTKKDCDAVLDALMPMSNMPHYEEGDGVPGSHILSLHVAIYQAINGLSERDPRATR